jgi:hypothetical protein
LLVSIQVSSHQRGDGEQMKLRLHALVAFVAGALALAGNAAASCDPNGSNFDGNWYSGWETGPPSGTCINGSTANILVYSPYVEYQDVTAWTMLYNQSTGSYGQIGYLKDSSGNRYNWSETSTVNTWDQVYWSAPTIGDDPEYKMTFSSGAFHYFINGSNVLTESNTGYTGCHAQQEGEVTNAANQMEGDTSTAVYFTYAQARRADTNAWYNLDGSGSADTPPYRGSFGYYKAASNHFDIWDPAC